MLDHFDLIENAVPGLVGRADLNRVAVAGHSMGGQTASMLLGAHVTQIAVPVWKSDALSALQRGDIAAFIAMYDDVTDAEHDVPLAPDGRPRKLVG